MNYNKLKRSVEKINMPEGMEERIIENCRKNQIQTGSSDKNEADFSQQVSGVDHISPHRNIIRIVSAVAACAVIAGCVGTTVHLMNRSSSPFYDGAESNTPAAEPLNTKETQDSSDKTLTNAATTMQNITQETQTTIVSKPDNTTAENTTAPPSSEDKNDNPSFNETVIDLRTLYNDQYVLTASFDKRKTFLDTYDLELLGQFFKENSKHLPFASESDEPDDLLNENEFQGDTFIYAEKEGSTVSYSIGFKEDKVIVTFINSDTNMKQLVFNNETANPHINAVVSTLIKNGSFEDSDNYYPPFGNLTKSTTKDIELSCIDGGKNTVKSIDNRKIHRTFYGYDWENCKIAENDVPQSIYDNTVYSFSAASDWNVTVYGDHYVLLSSLENIEGIADSDTQKQYYYVPDGTIGTNLQSLMEENS